MKSFQNPSISLRLLPLLDIVFILLAFFLILPQGIHHKRTTNLASHKSSSTLKGLNPSKFIYIEFFKDYFTAEYQELNFQKNGFIRRKYSFYYRDKSAKGQLPKGFLDMLLRVKSQLKALYPKEDICLVFQYSLSSKKTLFWSKMGYFAGFAKRNFSYIVVWKE